MRIEKLNLYFENQTVTPIFGTPIATRRKWLLGAFLGRRVIRVLITSPVIVNSIEFNFGDDEDNFGILACSSSSSSSVDITLPIKA